MSALVCAALLIWSVSATVDVGLPIQPLRGQSRGKWTVDLSLANRFDGNINHDVTPIRSYGIVPALAVGYERTRVALGYELALNTFTGTDEWDRVSHGAFAALSGRLGNRIRLETRAAATWKGSSDDRELSNDVGISERAAYAVREGTRLVVTGAWRFKAYPGDPATSGPSPLLSAKIDQQLPRDRRLAFGYKCQTRQSRAIRDRYVRSTFSLEFATPVSSRVDRFSIELQYRPQRYERLIVVDGRRVARRDRRGIAFASYSRPLNPRVTVAWEAGIEARGSNDADKRFVAPTAGMFMAWHWGTLR